MGSVDPELGYSFPAPAGSRGDFAVSTQEEIVILQARIQLQELRPGLIKSPRGAAVSCSIRDFGGGHLAPCGPPYNNILGPAKYQDSQAPWWWKVPQDSTA